MIIENSADIGGSIWNLFYDLYLDESSNALLNKQSRKLYEFASSEESWHNSIYGHFIRVCSSDTLAELRRYWSYYFNFEKLSPQRKKNIVNAFKVNINAKGKSFILSSARSAGPLFAHAIELTAEHFDHYWLTGLSSPDPKDAPSATYINPTMTKIQFGEGFVVHYGTHPLMAFPLAEAFVPLKGSNQYKISSHTLFDLAKRQFTDWCTSFKKCVTVKKVILRFFAGDALGFCHALNQFNIMKGSNGCVYTSPWKAVPLILHSGDYECPGVNKAPMSFEVIDTSNLIDHLGMLNLLVGTIPLLSKLSFSSILTESLLTTGSNEDAMVGLLDRLLGDPTLMTTLLDLVPSSFLSKFNTQSNTHEIFSYKTIGGGQIQFHERVVWRLLSLSDPMSNPPPSYPPPFISIPSNHLANFLFNLYLEMFKDEDKQSDMEQIFRQPNSVAKKLQTSNILHYVRESFAGLLGAFQQRIVSSDWDQALDLFLDLVTGSPKLLMGLNNYQDLTCHLFLRGVWPMKKASLFYPILESPKLNFGQWFETPSIVCVVLLVPREKLRVLEAIPLDKLSTPILHCTVRGPKFHNIFSSIQLTFGSIKSSVQDGISIEVDREGIMGNSALIASFWMPKWIILKEQTNTIISLSVRSTLATVALIPYLGFDLDIFSTKAMDTNHVFITQNRPNLLNNAQVLRYSASGRPSSSSPTISITLDETSHKIVCFTIKLNIVSPSELKTLAASANVTSSQISPSGIQVSFGSHDKIAFFPFPVDGSHTKLRVARKSGYIEVRFYAVLSTILSLIFFFSRY